MFAHPPPPQPTTREIPSSSALMLVIPTVMCTERMFAYINSLCTLRLLPTFSQDFKPLLKTLSLFSRLQAISQHFRPQTEDAFHGYYSVLLRQPYGCASYKLCDCRQDHQREQGYLQRRRLYSST